MTNSPQSTKHTKQIQCFNDPSRFKFLLTGRRGGKTHLITEDIVKTIHGAPNGAEVWYIGPTLMGAKELIWEALDDRIYDLDWQYQPMVSKSRFELSRNRKVYITGAEKIRRIRGHKALKVYLDEVAYFGTPLAEIWRAVRPTLADFKGGAIAATTPNGKGTDAYDFHLAALESPDWRCFSWHTYDNPYIDQEEVDAARHELDERSFRQEYEATWESFEGLAYYNFQEGVHIERHTIDPRLTLHLCFDFNVNPTTLLLSQYVQNRMVYIKEYSFANSSTEQTVKAFCEEYGKLANTTELSIRGDAAGKSRSSGTGKTDYQYVEEALDLYGFTYIRQVPPKNPPVVDRVKRVNGWLKPFTGEPRISIDPSCRELIRDLSSQALRGRMLDDTNNRGHKADALGYDIYRQSVEPERRRQRTIQL